MNTLKFTVYFPNEEKIKEFMDSLSIPYEMSETFFITWIYIPESHKQYKTQIENFIVQNKLQDGMKDEFRWLGWNDWVNGYEDRNKYGMKHY